MDYLEIGIIAIEFLAILAVGFILGKAIHRTVVGIAKVFTKKTATTLDDEILGAIEGPLKAISIIIFVYVISERLENLSAINATINQYAYSILILLGAYIISDVFGAVLRWYYYEGKRKSRIKIDDTILPFLRKVSKVVILTAGIYFALYIIGIDLSGLLTATSVMAIVLGLAAQETLANIFAGIALQLDRPFVYGDKLKFVTGEIATLKSIGLRTSKLEDSSGNIILISNSELAKQRLIKIKNKTERKNR
ncbi:mechanosensitive ion channel family protein [Candidatus Micrarchaeota archaeon]|nr:mechanosensitive ion channel family protein [Candidatus Micrarchaeota archaeon]